MDWSDIGRLVLTVLGGTAVLVTVVGGLSQLTAGERRRRRLRAHVELLPHLEGDEEMVVREVIKRDVRELGRTTFGNYVRVQSGDELRTITFVNRTDQAKPKVSALWVTRVVIAYFIITFTLSIISFNQDKNDTGSDDSLIPLLLLSPFIVAFAVLFIFAIAMIPAMARDAKPDVLRLLGLDRMLEKRRARRRPVSERQTEDVEESGN